MITTTFRTEPFTCPSCVKKIESAVGQMSGVQSVDVMFNSSKVKVTYDDTKLQSSEVADRITGLGYPVTRISGARASA